MSLHGRERLLSRPVRLEPGTPVDVVARACDAIEQAVGPPAGAAGRLGPWAPMEQRRADLLFRDVEALADVQRVQGILAGLPETAGTVAAVIEAPGLAARIAATLEALRPLPGAYDGTTTGHVAYLGHRPVELVLASSPATYRTLAPGSHRALAVTAALWEEFLGRTDLPAEAPEWDRFLEGTEKILRACGSRDTALRKWRRGAREKGGGRRK